MPVIDSSCGAPHHVRVHTADIDLRSLRCFVCVAEELHFAKAAARLNMSQPPLTKRIQALERQLGVMLLDRNTRQVRLTPAGATLLNEARRVFAQTQAMERAVRNVHEENAGTLRIGFISSAFVSTIQPHLPALTSALGPVEYVWNELASPQQVEAIRNHELDLCFVHTPIDVEGLNSFLIIRERCVVAMAATHPLAKRTSVRLADLAKEEFVLFPRGLAPGHYDRIVAACQAAGFEPNIRHQVRHYLTMLLLPASACGISIVPASADRLSVPGLVLMPIKDAELRAELTMLWHPDNDAPMLHRMLAELTSRTGFAAQRSRQKNEPVPA